ncbi:hypothetical protein RR46_14580 [Papilio xuthus]|uniref:Uncharacterized protein n=1 Tax=Papilio xuthus TaxID=66420 RepID=A0A194PCQ6_PAPXU|nr:hypothetical protein RR46_14580 [Papilio xuthus]
MLTLWRTSDMSELAGRLPAICDIDDSISSVTICGVNSNAQCADVTEQTPDQYKRPARHGAALLSQLALRMNASHR